MPRPMTSVRPRYFRRTLVPRGQRAFDQVAEEPRALHRVRINPSLQAAPGRRVQVGACRAVEDGARPQVDQTDPRAGLYPIPQVQPIQPGHIIRRGAKPGARSTFR